MGIPRPTELPSSSPFNQDVSARHDKTPPPSEVAATTQHMLHSKEFSGLADPMSSRSSADLTRFTSRNGATWRVLWE